MNDIDVLGESQDDSLSSGLDYSDGIMSAGCVRSDSLFSLYMDGSDPLQSSPESSLSSPFKENQSLMEGSAIELSNQTTKQSSPLRRSPFRQQQQQQQQAAPMVNLRKKSSHRSRAAVLKRFQEREMSWPSSHQSNGNQPLKTGSVVSIAALKAALTQSPTSHYLDNGELYYPQRLQKQQQQQQQSKTVFVSDYIWNKQVDFFYLFFFSWRDNNNNVTIERKRRIFGNFLIIFPAHGEKALTIITHSLFHNSLLSSGWEFLIVFNSFYK